MSKGEKTATVKGGAALRLAIPRGTRRTTSEKVVDQKKYAGTLITHPEEKRGDGKRGIDRNRKEGKG